MKTTNTTKRTPRAKTTNTEQVTENLKFENAPETVTEPETVEKPEPEPEKPEQTNALVKLEDDSAIMPEEITVNYNNTEITISAEQTLTENIINVTRRTGDKALDKYLDILAECQTALCVGALKIGFTFARIREKDKNGKAPWEHKFPSYKDFLDFVHISPKKESRLRNEADYFTEYDEDGKPKFPQYISRGKASESVLAFVFAKKLNTAILERICKSLDNGQSLRTVKQFVTAYNEYIAAIETDDDSEKPEQIGEDGKPITPEEKANAVETTADSTTTDGVKRLRCTVHGRGIADNAAVMIPADILPTHTTLFPYVVENAAELAEKCGLDINTENDITYTVCVTPCVATITFVQTKPSVKAVTIMRQLSTFGNGLHKKPEPEPEPEPEQTTEPEQAEPVQG